MRQLFLICSVIASLPLSGQAADPIRILFLGDNGHHRPGDRAAQLIPVMDRVGIEIQYTDDAAAALQPQTLSKYDGLLIYANIARIEPDQEKALLDYVASGKGLIPLHCATYCFLNSSAYVDLVGAQFQRHGGQEMTTEIAAPEHPIMRGFESFTSWDETYIHHRHNEQNRTVLSYRVQGDQAEGQTREPWTWVRTHGKGRIFYTAWGHDQRTWSNPGFHNLVERGIRWAVKDDPSVVPEFRNPDAFVVPTLTAARTDVKPFEYVEAELPNYLPGEQWGTLGEPIRKMQKPLTADESLKHFRVPEGFEVKLFASEPQLGGKPIAMSWDERGRLWVCETYDYPNELQPPGEGRDRIRICEDTDGDWVADKFTVFAEKLSIPTSMAFYRGGVIVQDAVRTLYLKDTDGDDRADVQEVLFTGWALGDTHGGVSNFQYGLDNWIWAMQGYNLSEPVVQGQKQQSFRMGFFRFRPDGSELEFIRSTNNNTWGLGISEEGIIFGSTANRNPSVYMPIPNRYYERVRGWAPQQLGTIADTYLFKPVTENVRQVDQHGGYTAGAGHALYTARNYPQQYWNRTAFVCGPTGHLVGMFLLKKQGADFSSTSPTNLAASDDEWSAPIMAEVGPDGNVWMLDWYNYIVQHNPTPVGYKTGKGNAYETELRDKKHGRIYRLVYRDAAESEPLSLRPDNIDQLVQTLRHPTMLWRKHAQRLLVEGKHVEAVPSLVGLIRDQKIDAIGLNVGAIHALWTLKGLGAIEPGSDVFAAVTEALRHPSAGVRRNAAAVLPPAGASVEALVESDAIHDRDAQVQLAALLALADAPEDARAGSAAARAVASGRLLEDRWLADALTSAAAVHAVEFIDALTAERVDTLHPRAGELLTTVAEHIGRSRPDLESTERVIAAIGRADQKIADPLIVGLSRGWPRQHQIQIGKDSELVLGKLVQRLSAGSQGQLLRLATYWGSKELEKYAAQIVERLVEAVSDSERPLDARLRSARELVEFRPGDDELVGTLLNLITPQSAPEFSTGLVDALAASTAPSVGTELVDRAGSLTPAARSSVVRVLLSRPETTRSLLDGIKSGALTFSDLKLDQKQALQNHPNREIRALAVAMLKGGGGLPDPDRDKVLKSLLPLTAETGDAAAGKEVFKKQCSKCHMHSGEGQKIGPDLTGMAVHPKAELLTHIIDPSRSVEGNFRLYTVVTVDGRVWNGMLAAETRTSIELIDTEAKRQVIQREDIDEMAGSRKSLMPEGFEKQVNAEGLVNLLEFLTARGQFVPLDLRKVASIATTRGMFYDENSTVERLDFGDWSPKTFAGVPFQLIDPQGDRIPNAVMLYGPQGKFPPQMPRSVSLPVNQPAKAIHMLGGVGGWAAKGPRENGSVSMVVRIHYADGSTEDHPLLDGQHMADYIGEFNVPESKLAFKLQGRQVRYLTIQPDRQDKIERIELVKGPDRTAPVVMAITVESL